MSSVQVRARLPCGVGPEPLAAVEAAVAEVRDAVQQAGRRAGDVEVQGASSNN